jgi:hypothetical protein
MRRTPFDRGKARRRQTLLNAEQNILKSWPGCQSYLSAATVDYRLAHTTFLDADKDEIPVLGNNHD